ncbi:hypothetical protein HMPREF9714_03341 [Myroides odoratimimus CCUG 12901]|uniref:hypothetical protein n=1 Tax=Myroides odoratimimus TaxID=76832 RepID=UPI000246114D|nr:hypothetical protein [Myroides odoratimimus]EHO05403.1 hypothetical protein HMPREF9714_03341 [Myroides odoratimimus CCUG 12901]
MERIIFWLESKSSNYFEGLQLYESLPTHNKNLVRNLKRAESAFNRQKLIYELRKVVNTTPPKKTITVTPTSPVEENTISPSPVLTTVKDQEKKTALLFHQLPVQVRPILLEANNLFKENCLLKTELNELHADQEAEALSIQIQIDRNEKANTLAWSKIDYYLKHKCLPPTSRVNISKLSIDKLMYKRNLLEASLSKQRKRLTANKEKLSILEGTELHKLQRAVAKQEKAVLEKEEQLFKIKSELDGKK